MMKRRRLSKGALGDPNMIWQTFKACKQRGEEHLAMETLFKYVELWLESSISQSHNLRFRLEPHILPSLAFEETGSEWLLQQRPQGVLTALVDMAVSYNTQLQEQGTQKVFQGRLSQGSDTIFSQLPILMIALYKIACCHENITTVMNSRLFGVVADILQTCLTAILTQTIESEERIKQLIDTMGSCMTILHILFDPRHVWVSTLSTNKPLADSTKLDPMPINQEILKMINAVCTKLHAELKGTLEDEYQTLLLECLHLLGAALSGSETNAQLAVMNTSDTFLYTLLEPRESCSSIQVLTVRVSVRMIHVIHCWVPEELLANIDIRVLVSILLNILSPRWKNEQLVPPHSEFVISILQCFSVLCNPPFNEAELKEILIDIAVMEKVAEVLNTLKQVARENPAVGSRLCCSVLKAYGHLLHQSSVAQDAFEQRVGYERLRKLLSSVATPTEDILKEILNIAVEDKFTAPRQEYMTIHNTSMISMLIRWVPSISQPLRSWLVSHLFDLCTQAIHNRQLCCSVGMLRVVVEVLSMSQCSETYVGSEVEDQLIQLVQVLGSHSIVAAELKQIIGALRTTEDRHLPSYYYQLQQALCSMAQTKEGVTPLYYFDLRQPGSHISIPDLQNWPNPSGFTFHAWVCLNAPSSLGRPMSMEMGERFRCRRILYSFYTNSGTGYEAFFTENMNFVVATMTKREFHAYIVYKAMFRSSEWHSVCIVHQSAKRLFNKEILIYIDGNLADSAVMKAPGLTDKYHYCYIGSCVTGILQKRTVSSISSSDLHSSYNELDQDSDIEPDTASSIPSSMAVSGVNTIPVQDLEEKWGVATHLGGLLSSICIFSESISMATITTLFHYGANKLSLFQPNCSKTHELSQKLIVYYHPKACRDGQCVNLSPLSISEIKYTGLFSGQPYVTWDVKDVLSSLGGVELLFPLLEQVAIPLKVHQSSPTDKQLMDSQLSINEQLQGSSAFNDKEGAAAFIFLLEAMLDGCSTNQEVFFLRQGPATIGALLLKVSPSLLTQQFLAAIQRLANLLTDNESFKDIETHILFNFAIWSRPDVEIRKEHLQYISTLIQAKTPYYRNCFGIQFILDIIRVYYSCNGAPPTSSNEGVVPLSREDTLSVRSGLFNIVKLYLMSEVTKEDVCVIVRFITACQDSTMLAELLGFILNLLINTSSSLGQFLWVDGLFLMVLIQAESQEVRLLAIKIISNLLKSFGASRNGPINQKLESGALAAAVCQMAQYEVPPNMVLALLELCTSQSNSDLTDYISNIPLYLAVLQLLRNASLIIRDTVCQQVISLLHLNPSHTNDIACQPGWDSLFLWLLCDNNNDATKGMPINGETSLDWPKTADEDDPTFRTFAVVTETMGYILWHQTKDKQVWKTWGCLLTSLDIFAKEHPLIVPVYIIKKRLFSLLINALSLEAKSSGPTKFLKTLILQLTQLFETFVINSYPSCLQTNSVNEIEESMDMIRECSHCVALEIDTEHCSPELLVQYLDMLNSFQMITCLCTESDELSIIQSLVRILLSCMASRNTDYYLPAATRLLSIVQYGNMDKQDIFFVMKNVSSFIHQCDPTEVDSDYMQHIAAVIREILMSSKGLISFEQHLPNLPNVTNSPNFREEFLKYSKGEEWTRFHQSVLTPKANQYNIVLFPWLSSCATRRKDALNWYQNNEQKRKNIIHGQLQEYQEEVLQPYFEQREEEVKRQKRVDSIAHNDYISTLLRWRAFRKFYTGERGAWSSRVPDPYLWGLSRTENFSRMRMKLARHYTSNDHSDAAKQRDLYDGGVSSHSITDKELLAQATRTTDINYDEDEQLLLQAEQQLPEEAEVTKEDEKEKIIRTEKCDLIMLMECIPGKIEITNKHIFFFAEHLQEKKELINWYTPEFKVMLSDLREIHSRRYNMSRTALEIFLVDQTNYFLNFSSRKTVQRIYSSILSLRPPNLNRVGIHKPSKLLQTAGLIEKWKKREISNFDYLMQLNMIAGRTYNDLNQYPIFPWVLSDYKSSELDLSNPSVYRDFSKPMGAQNPNLREGLSIKYNELQDPILGSFHYGSHYSNAAGVLHFLIRLEPFTTLHIDLQSGRFDVADRQFISIPSTWDNIYKGSSDVKELIPEFYFLPDFLNNVNKFDLGVRVHTGQRINDIELPPWAEDADDFIQKQKDALESEYVSQHLHEWIDLIFGYKQSGAEAEKSLNVFLKYSYEENVNLDEMKDETDRRRVEAMINNFGQTPTKLFNEPHPKRWTVDQAKKNPGRGYLVGGRRSQVNLLERLSKLKAYSVDISVSSANSVDDAVVFVGTPTIQTRALLVSGNPEQLITVTSTGLLNVHGWLPFSNARNRPFTFNFDPNTHFDRSRWLRVGAPFAQDIVVCPRNFVLSQNNKLLVTGGHWDNSFRIFSVDKSKLIDRIAHHNDIVTCMTLDKAGTGEHLVTGSRDTTCVVWRFKNDELINLPLVTLYGHDSEVLCVDISTELDMVVSGAKDGSCIIHTVRGGHYVHTLRPRGRHMCEIHHVIISSQGKVLVYSQGPLGKSRPLSVPPCIHLYTVNGKLLKEKELAEPLNAIVIVNKYIITGNNKGFLTFRDLSTLRQLSSLNLLVSIRCISVVLDHQSKVCTHLLVGLHNGKLIIVSVKD